MGEDGQVLPLNDGNWPFAAYILGRSAHSPPLPAPTADRFMLTA